MRLLFRPTAVLPLAALLALGSSGCGAGHDAVMKELGELRAEVTKLRAAQGALAERVDGLEIQSGTFAKAAPKAPSAAPSGAPAAAPNANGDRPDLAVVKLSPSEGDGDADSDAPRPVIKAEGNAGTIQKGDGRKPKDAQKKGASPKPVKP
jgi:hypothetical protein